ncbi:hypothetical protein M8494_01680 [Serratia ureilytica]
METTRQRSDLRRQPVQAAAVEQHRELREPIAECHMLMPQEYLGNVITLCVEKRRADQHGLPRQPWR